jgi:hypothetical protein
MTPTTVRKCIGWLRRCHALRPLWGKNSAVAVTLFLELLSEPLPHPLAAFGQNFHLYFT